MTAARATVLALGTAALAALWPAVAIAAPPGAIHELPQPTRVDEISAGPHGELWFATSRKQKAVGWIGGDDRVHRFDLPRYETAGRIVAADGGAWFSYYRYRGGLGSGFESGIGYVTKGGKVTNFQGYPTPGLDPNRLAVGPEGDVWFDGGGPPTNEEDWIGRMTPSGEYSVSNTGQPLGVRIVSLAWNQGDLWFADAQFHTIGRLAPGGELTTFEAARAYSPPYVDPPAFGPDGTAYFVTKQGSQGQGSAWGIAEVAPGASSFDRFERGLSPKVFEIGSPVVAPGGSVWFGIERKEKAGTAASPDGSAALGRLTANGRITEFSRCLRPAELPEDLTVGPDGDVWFTTRNDLGEVQGPDADPSIGRITPSGAINEFRYGFSSSSEPKDLTSAGGRVWFVDDSGEHIGELEPPRRPVNTFLVEAPRGGGLIRARLPGPGRLEVKESGVLVGNATRYLAPGLSTRTVAVGGCGPVTVPLPVLPPLRRHLEAKRHLTLTLRVTYTPRGGTPFSQVRQAQLEAR